MDGSDRVRREVGDDLTTLASKPLDQFNGQEVAVAVTMGCGDECPLAKAVRREEWQIPDPKEMPPEQYREVRDLIEMQGEGTAGEASPDRDCLAATVMQKWVTTIQPDRRTDGPRTPSRALRHL